MARVIRSCFPGTISVTVMKILAFFLAVFVTVKVAAVRQIHQSVVVRFMQSTVNVIMISAFITMMFDSFLCMNRSNLQKPMVMLYHYIANGLLSIIAFMHFFGAIGVIIFVNVVFQKLPCIDYFGLCQYFKYYFEI